MIRKKWFGHKTSKKKHLKIKFHKFKKFFCKNKYKASILLTITIILVSVWLVVSQTFLSEDNIIRSVEFHPDNADISQDLKLYQSLREQLQGQNIFDIQYRKLPELTSQISQAHPLIKDIALTRLENNQIVLIFEPNYPEIVISDWEWYFAGISNQLIPIPDDTSLLSWAKIIDIPTEYQELNDLDGFFYRISSEHLAFQIWHIKNFFEWDDIYFSDQPKATIKNIKYLPWGSKTLVETKDKKIRFDNTHSIIDQLKKYHLLTTNKDQHEKLQNINISQIDIGTQQEYIFVQ